MHSSSGVSFSLPSEIHCSLSRSLSLHTDSFYGTHGTLGAALYSAEDGDVIDCSPIAGQTISFIGNPLPAIGINFTSSTSSLTILGSGVIIEREAEGLCHSFLLSTRLGHRLLISRFKMVSPQGGSWRFRSYWRWRWNRRRRRSYSTLRHHHDHLCYKSQ